MHHYQQIIIDVVGWVYFSAWAISFWGQIYENIRQKR